MTLSEMAEEAVQCYDSNDEVGFGRYYEEMVLLGISHSTIQRLLKDAGFVKKPRIADITPALSAA